MKSSDKSKHEQIRGNIDMYGAIMKPNIKFGSVHCEVEFRSMHRFPINIYLNPKHELGPHLKS